MCAQFSRTESFICAWSLYFVKARTREGEWERQQDTQRIREARQQKTTQARQAHWLQSMPIAKPNVAYPVEVSSEIFSPFETFMLFCYMTNRPTSVFKHQMKRRQVGSWHTIWVPHMITAFRERFKKVSIFQGKKQRFVKQNLWNCPASSFILFK